MSGVLPPDRRGTGLVDVLDRVLDKGLVVAGDIRVSLADVELLTIRIRLVVCSLDKAREVGLDWWRGDPYFSPATLDAQRGGDRALRRQIRQLDEKVEEVAAPRRAARRRSRGRRRP